MSENIFAPPGASLEVKEGPEALWEMTFKEVRKLYLASVNVHALGFLYGLGAVGVIAAGGIFLVTPLKDAGGAEGIGAAFAALLVLLGLIYVAAAISSYTRPRWGRWLGIVLCALGLLSFPFGTIIGIMGLIAYAQGGKLFGPERLQHKDVAAVYKQRKKDKQ
jgi:hypothetical protein